MAGARNLTRTQSLVTPLDRETLLGQKGAVIWFTGLSGSGKSTLAYALEKRLISIQKHAFVLDGDNIRLGLCKDLGFSPEERNENIRRVGEVAALFANAGTIVLSSFISPYKKDRETVRQTVKKGSFIEVYLDVSVDVCEKRDPKGLYQKARSGDIPHFTGISAPYEKPDAAELSVKTDQHKVETCVDQIIQYLDSKGFFHVS